MPQASSLIDGARGHKLHVGLVHESWPPAPSFGGIVRYLVCLAEGLRDRGHDVTVVTTGRLPATTQDIEDGIRVVRVPPVLGDAPLPLRVLLFHLAMSARYASALAMVHSAHPIDIVEFSNWAAEGFVHSLRKTRPHVTRVSTMDWQSRDLAVRAARSRYGAIADRWRDWIEALPVRRSDLVLAHTAEHAGVVARRVRLGAIPEVMALGASDQAGAGLEPAAAGQEPSRELLFVGKLDPRKGFDTLVEAFALAHPGLPSNARLLVAGSDTNHGPGGGSFRDHVLSSVSQSVRSRIDLLGWVSDEALVDLYRRSGVVVAPSRYESFGLPFIEAMQHGRAVIGTTAGGIPGVVSDGVEGLLIAPGDVEALATAITRLLTDIALRQRLERAARARYEHEYTQAAFASRAETAYRRVIATRRAARAT